MTKYDEKIYEVINLLQTIEDKESTDREKQEVENKLNKIIDNLNISKREKTELKNKSFTIKNRDVVKYLILENLEECSSIVIEKIKEFYPHAFDDKAVINIEDMLYKEDGKLFFERINEWFKKYSQEEISLQMLQYHMLLTNETETYHLIPELIKAKIKNTVYIGIEPGYGCDRTCCNTEYDIGDAYPEDDVELPPYHANCKCEAVFYDIDDLTKLLEDKI